MELVDFLVAAKRATYATAGEGGERRVGDDGARELTYTDGPWAYRDVYHGTNPFVGRELVHRDGRLVWSMVYYGATTAAEVAPVYAFLKSALRRVEASSPYRGPGAHVERDWSYAATVSGDLTHFVGEETIRRSGVPIYRLTFTGGRLDGAG